MPEDARMRVPSRIKQFMRGNHCIEYVFVCHIQFGKIPKWADKNTICMDDIPADDRNDGVVLVSCQNGHDIQSYMATIHIASRSLSEWSIIPEYDGPLMLTKW